MSFLFLVLQTHCRMGVRGTLLHPRRVRGGHGAVCPKKERQTVDCGPQSLGGSGLVMPGKWPGKETHLGTQKSC